MPGEAEDAAVSVSVEDPEPGAAIDAGLSPAVTPVGSPEALRAIAELKPPETAAVIVDAPCEPCATGTEVGEAEKVKLAAVGNEARALIRPALGLPQPVTRS